tara:strand:+ start:568 stop:762 length:195 start_codon:yes stop_codon:yes gene_type:complete
MHKIVPKMLILITSISFLSPNITLAGDCSSHSNKKREFECSKNDEKCLDIINKNKLTKTGDLNV